MADKVVVYLKFVTAGGKTSSVTINNPRENVTLADAKAAADVLVAQQVIEGSDSTALTGFKEATKVTTSTVELA